MAIALDGNHDIYLGSRSGIALVTGADAVAQSILTRLRLLKGEYYLNPNEGTPWLEDILGSSRDTRRLDRILRDRILDTPGVDRLIRFVPSIDRDARILSIEFNADTIFGETGLIEVTL